MLKIMREMYLNGNTPEEIASALNVSRTTFYYHKKADFKRGIDWDQLKLERLRSEQELENKEAIFINSLIENYERFLKNAGELDASQIENLHKFARTYWSIKAPRQLNEKEIISKATKKALESIANLAIELQNEAAATFLSENAEKIISDTIKSLKNAN